MNKKIVCWTLVILSLVSLIGCSNSVDMPFNGDIAFHEISLTVPERFIRDSTQSSTDRWIFEYHSYTECIILVKNQITETDIPAYLESYRLAMAQHGTSELIFFHGETAVQSSYDKNGEFCQEIFFTCGNSSYAVALRGGTEASFRELVSTIQFAATE